MTKNLADELQRTARQALSGMHPSPQGEEAGGLPFRKLLAAAFRARYLVFGTTLFGILVGSFLAITTANSYVSTGKFMFTGSGAERTQLDSQRSTETSHETIGTAASYILSTDELLRRVVDKLTPARILAPFKPGNPGDSAMKAFFFMVQRDWNATKEEERTPEGALKYLRKAIFVERPRYTEVLVATCTANDQKLAQEILATYMDEAIKFHIEQYERKSAYEEAEKRKDETLLAYEAARRAERDFLDRKAGVPDFEAEKKRLQAEEAAALTAVTKLRNDLASAQNTMELRIRQLEGDKAIPMTRLIRKKVDKTTETLNLLQRARAEKELEKVDVAAQTPGSTRLNELESVIKKIKESIDNVLAETKDAPLEEVIEDNPDYIAARNDRSKLALDIEGLKGQLKFAEDMQRTNAAKLKALLELDTEYEKLHNDVMVAEDTMQAAQITWLAAQNKRELALGNFSSLSAFEKASYPLEKEGPNRGKLLLGGMLVGLFLGLGVIVLRALPDTIVRTRNDLEHIDGIAVIGLMPRLDNRNLKRHSHLRGQGW